MKKSVMVALLAVLGLVLLAMSFTLTAYDRGSLAAAEQGAGAVLLFLAAGLFLGGMGDPAEPKAAKKNKEPAAEEKK